MGRGIRQLYECIREFVENEKVEKHEMLQSLQVMLSGDAQSYVSTKMTENHIRRRYKSPSGSGKTVRTNGTGYIQTGKEPIKRRNFQMPRLIGSRDLQEVWSSANVAEKSGTS